MIKKYSFLLPVFFAAFSFEYAAAQQIGLVKNINVHDHLNDGESSRPQHFIEMNGKLYFVATQDGQGIGNTVIWGTELWVTEGTDATTHLCADVDSGGYDGVFSKLCTINNKLIFAGRKNSAYRFWPLNIVDSMSGIEIFASDGTQAGTVLLKDIYPGYNSWSEQGMSSYPDIDGSYTDSINGKLYFTATSPDEGKELWVTDGTPVGTFLLKDIEPGAGTSDPFVLGAVNGKVLFVATAPDYGRELWITDGTSAGTTLFIDFAPGTASGGNISSTQSNNVQERCFVHNNKLFFNQGYNGERAVWVTDGTINGTNKINGVHWASGLIEFNNRLYFQGEVDSAYLNTPANISGSVYRLCSTDGTANGTQVIQKVSLPVSELYTFNNKLYFAGSNKYSAGASNNLNVELWGSDGTENGTTEVADLNPPLNPPQGMQTSSYPHGFLTINGKLYVQSTADSVYFTGFNPSPNYYQTYNIHSVDGNGTLNVVYSTPNWFFIAPVPTTNKADFVRGLQNGVIMATNDSLTKSGNDYFLYNFTGTWPPSGVTYPVPADFYLPYLRDLSSSFYLYNNKYYFGVQISGKIGIELYTFNPVTAGTGVKELKSTPHNLVLFPNPAGEYINVGLNENVMYQILNISGTQVRTGYMQKGNPRISLSGLPPGSYVLMTKKMNDEVQRAKFTVSK